MYYFDNPKKTPLNLVMGDTLDQREYFRDYCLTQKGKLLWDQIHMLHGYARELCLRYDYTCCSRIKAPHLPFSCKFNDNQTLDSYANSIYDYYDVERIDSSLLRVLMKLNLCLKSMKLLMMMFIGLKILLYLNIAMIIMNIIPILMCLLRKYPLPKKRLIC